MSRRFQGVGVGAVIVASLAFYQATLPAQPQADRSGRFEFQVVESFDAHYLGDSPGHLGRGNIGKTRPDVALGDPVYHDAAKIGTVTNLRWDRPKESLEVEFDPEPFEVDSKGRPVRPTRVTLGQTVWVPLGGEPAKSDAKKEK